MWLRGRVVNRRVAGAGATNNVEVESQHSHAVMLGAAGSSTFKVRCCGMINQAGKCLIAICIRG